MMDYRSYVPQFNRDRLSDDSVEPSKSKWKLYLGIVLFLCIVFAIIYGLYYFRLYDFGYFNFPLDEEMETIKEHLSIMDTEKANLQTAFDEMLLFDTETADGKTSIKDTTKMITKSISNFKKNMEKAGKLLNARKQETVKSNKDDLEKIGELYDGLITDYQAIVDDLSVIDVPNMVYIIGIASSIKTPLFEIITEDTKNSIFDALPETIAAKAAAAAAAEVARLATEAATKKAIEDAAAAAAAEVARLATEAATKKAIEDAAEADRIAKLNQPATLTALDNKVETYTGKINNHVSSFKNGTMTGAEMLTNVNNEINTLYNELDTLTSGSEYVKDYFGPIINKYITANVETILNNKVINDNKPYVEEKSASKVGSAITSITSTDIKI